MKERNEGSEMKGRKMFSSDFPAPIFLPPSSCQFFLDSVADVPET